MPRYIMKADQKHDLFVEWSTIVDAPIQWGPRADFHSIDPARLDRAEATGTSMHPETYGDRTFHEGAWGDSAMIVTNMGTDYGFYELERGKLYDFIAALGDTPEDPATQQAALNAHAKKMNLED